MLAWSIADKAPAAVEEIIESSALRLAWKCTPESEKDEFRRQVRDAVEALERAEDVGRVGA
jgi:hypothetical protein